MSRKPRPNISPSLVGELFLKPGEDVPYRLILCNTEPTAVIQRVDRAEPDTPTGISRLSGLVHLLPERPIAKPRKERSDKGSHKATKSAETARIAPIPASEDTSNLLIHVPSGVGEDTDYIIMIAGSDGTGKTMKEAVLAVLGKFGGKIPASLTTKQKKQIQDILDPKKPE